MSVKPPKKPIGRHTTRHPANNSYQKYVFGAESRLCAVIKAILCKLMISSHRTMSNPLRLDDSQRTRAKAHPNKSLATATTMFSFLHNFKTIKVYCEILKNSSETPSNTEFCVLKHSHTGNYTTFWITVNVANVEATKGSENNSFRRFERKNSRVAWPSDALLLFSGKLSNFSDLSCGKRYLLYPNTSIPRSGKPLSSSEHRTYSFWFTFLHGTSRTTLFLIFPTLCTCSLLLEWILLQTFSSNNPP